MEELKIRFKSTPNNWAKEVKDIKNNTLRKVDISDERFQKLLKFSEGYPQIWLLIEIENTKTGVHFTREVKDVTYWEGFCIITWIPQELHPQPIFS